MTAQEVYDKFFDDEEYDLEKCTVVAYSYRSGWNSALKRAAIVVRNEIRPQGEWIEDDYAGIHCSKCFYIPLKDVVKTIHADGTEERSGNFNLTPYCPNCGAKMKGGTE